MSLLCTNSLLLGMPPGFYYRIISACIHNFKEFGEVHG